jgi:hypothetical protein
LFGNCCLAFANVKRRRRVVVVCFTRHNTTLAITLTAPVEQTLFVIDDCRCICARQQRMSTVERFGCGVGQMLARGGNAWLAATSVTYRALITDSQAPLDSRLAMPYSGPVCLAFGNDSSIVVMKSYLSAPELYSYPWDPDGSMQTPATTCYWTGMLWRGALLVATVIARLV